MNHENLKTEKISSLVFKLGVPATIGMLVIAFYNLVDTYFVAGLGVEAVGAATVVFPISMSISSIAFAIGTGTSSYVSRLLGEKDLVKASVVASTSYFTSLLLSALLALLCAFFMKQLLYGFGATASIFEYAYDYALIVLIGSVLNVGTVSANHIIRSEGLAKISMISMIMGAIINILLDPIFIYTLDFGIKGAAWATVIAQFCSLAFIMLYVQFGKAQVEIAFKHFKPTKAIYYEVLKIGIPVLFYHLLQNVSMGIINNQASLYGDYAVAAIGIVTRILTLLSYVVFGFSKGYQPIAGYCYGSKMYDRLNEATNFTLKVLTGYCILSAGIVLIFGYPLLGLFSQSTAVLVIAHKTLVLWLITYIFLGYQMTYITLFMSIGKARESALLGLCRQGLCLIPLLLILPHFFHLNGILLAQATADICALTLTIYFKRKSYVKGHLGVI